MEFARATARFGRDLFQRGSTSKPLVKPISNPGVRFASLGRCIWCWPPDKGNPPHGEEHIIPRSFGGNLVIAKASCAQCERRINKFETSCLNGMVGAARYHMGIDSLGRKRRNFAPVLFKVGERLTSVSVALKEHPAALVLPVMGPAGIMLGLPLTALPSPAQISVCIAPVTPDFHRRVQAFRHADNIHLNKPLDAVSCYRLIAKIAHAYLCAIIGLNNFVPTLLHVVNLKGALFANYWIGSFINPSLGPYSSLHEIALEPSIFHGEWEFLVVRVRLFAHLGGLPTYYAVAGRRLIQNG